MGFSSDGDSPTARLCRLLPKGRKNNFNFCEAGGKKDYRRAS